MVVEIIPLPLDGEIGAGDLAGPLADAIGSAGVGGAARDILVVTQKIVSKAEGRFVRLDEVAPTARAGELAAATGKDPRLVELVLAESSAIVRAAPDVLITRHRSGLVMANAGIDQSNLGPGREGEVLLLPIDADETAARLHRDLAARSLDLAAVVVCDSFGRPWRYGVIQVAIGAAGLPALVDRRGDRDRDGRMLAVTQTALADMVASAAGLVIGEGAEGVPAALVRGLDWNAPARPARALIRPLKEDLFR